MALALTPRLAPAPVRTSPAAAAAPEQPGPVAASAAAPDSFEPSVATRLGIRSGFGAQRATHVNVHPSVVLPANLDPTQADAEVTLPASAFLHDPATLVSAEVPVAGFPRDVSVSVEGDQVRLQLPAVAFTNLSPMLQLRYREGGKEIIVLDADGMMVDDTASRRRQLEQNVAAAREQVAYHQGELDAARARGPIPPGSRARLEAETATKESAKVALEAARPEILEQVKNASYADLISMSPLDRALDPLREAMLDAHEDALHDASKVPAERAATDALRAAIVQTDLRLAVADRHGNKTGPFARAFDALREATTSERILTDIVAQELRRNQATYDGFIASNTRGLADAQAQLASAQQQLDQAGVSRRFIPAPRSDVVLFSP